MKDYLLVCTGETSHREFGKALGLRRGLQVLWWYSSSDISSPCLQFLVPGGRAGDRRGDGIKSEVLATCSNVIQTQIWNKMAFFFLAGWPRASYLNPHSHCSLAYKMRWKLIVCLCVCSVHEEGPRHLIFQSLSSFSLLNNSVVTVLNKNHWKKNSAVPLDFLIIF